MDAPTTPNHPGPTHNSSSAPAPEDMIDIMELFRRIGRGLSQIIGLGLLALVITAVVYLLTIPRGSVTTSTRVAFSFQGIERGLYPDNSKFQADDLRSPDVVLDALKRLDVPTSETFQTRIRAALNVEGVVPVEIIKQRDRLLASGQSPSPFIPDEYIVTLVLPRSFPLSTPQRERLLNEIVSAFRAKFQRTYEAVPKGFGNAFETLRDADFLEYELILNEEIQNISQYLTQRLEFDKSYRSPTTNLSFSDLLKMVTNFAQIRMFETLGQVQVNGLSKDRRVALIKIDYHLRTLADRERQAQAEEEVVQSLLSKSQERSQGYVLASKSAASATRQDSSVVLDQGLIDSLLANDSYNFLVRRALDAGLAVKRLQAEKAVLMERRKSLETFLQSPSQDQSTIIAHLENALKQLENSYHVLIQNIRATQEDFNRQRFADAVRLSANVNTDSAFRRLNVLALLGFSLGVGAGIGLSLLGIYIKPRSRPGT